ncbi:hypothetical protein [Aureimonas jatrophae]|uniref:Uncharacterized protein n=1 Tax=Aureimonas jatrophae TaxID=1166073 RepID=A0A1H0IFN1_9HYPH|nr:hypothetical protein [Aureimonas jatrophae]MBB3952138.1 hypothetical protein [Aureimonas jatrophae]SDO30090.1 hypothetical protein SAMN05192530_105114 [Aureimonas jatrophae]
MSAMEHSLRRALEAGDTRDPGFRESIYAASERALERMLETRRSDEAEALQQRQQLAETINRVEAEFAASNEPLDDTAADAAAFAPDDEDVRDAREPRAYAADVVEDEAADDWRPGALGAEPMPAGRRGVQSPFAVPLLAIALAVLLGLLAYFVGGLLRGDEPAATPAATDQSAELPALNWIDVFDGDDLQALSTPNGGRVETVARDDGRSAVRASGPSGGEGEIEVGIGPGVARELAGRNIRIELTAGSPDGASREFGVRCLFGGTSTCDRQRFTTSMSEEAFVFDVTVPAGLSSGGSLALSTGLDGTATDVDIYRVRILRLS